jgi:large subunit ribosomal protein L25
VGESLAVKTKGGVLLTQSNHLAVEALPQDMPQHIDVDISGLNELGMEIKVKDLKTAGNYEIKEEVEKVVISVIEHKEESITPETAPTVAPEVITEKPAEGDETATGTEPAKPAPAAEEKKSK